jgi:hypothetical protein
MGQLFHRLVRHEKLLAAVTLALVAALVLQLKYCRRPEPQEITLTGGATAPSPGAETADLSGVWAMSMEKRRGGAQEWTLTLRQEGERLEGFIRSEGGDLAVSGTVRGRAVELSAERMGVTVEFPAAFDGERLAGTMRALTVERRWTARRK